MYRVTRCLRCGKRTVPTPGIGGRTELKCVFCDELDPLKFEEAKWADSPLAKPASSLPSKRIYPGLPR